MFLVENNMQIIWNPEAIDRLSGSHTILELETFETEKGPLTAYCIVPAEKALSDIAQLENLIGLHEGFVKAFKENNKELCNEIYTHLIGKFGGELDTFYQEIVSRFK